MTTPFRAKLLSAGKIAAPRPAAGELAIPGAPGRDAGSPVAFVFPDPACVWHVIHDFGRRPRVLVMDEDGTEVLARVRHFDVNVLEIGFALPFGGTVYLS